MLIQIECSNSNSKCSQYFKTLKKIISEHTSFLSTVASIGNYLIIKIMK